MGTNYLVRGTQGISNPLQGNRGDGWGVRFPEGNRVSELEAWRTRCVCSHRKQAVPLSCSWNDLFNIRIGFCWWPLRMPASQTLFPWSFLAVSTPFLPEASLTSLIRSSTPVRASGCLDHIITSRFIIISPLDRSSPPGGRLQAGRHPAVFLPL